MAKLSPAQVDQIEAWAEKGKSGLWIAGHLNLNPSTVNYRMLRAGYDPWPNGGDRAPATQPGAFSAEEDARMLELGAQGMAPHKIARVMQRPKTSLLIRLMTLEVRAEKKLEKAL
jgi:hypothetical protein